MRDLSWAVVVSGRIVAVTHSPGRLLLTRRFRSSERMVLGTKRRIAKANRISPAAFIRIVSYQSGSPLKNDGAAGREKDESCAFATESRNNAAGSKRLYRQGVLGG